MNWKSFSKPEEIKLISDRSYQVPCLIFKHSSRCSISYVAKLRLESDWPFQENEMDSYFLDLIANKETSNAVAEQLQVHHESPQIIVIRQGEVILDASHLDISVEEIKGVLASDLV